MKQKTFSQDFKGVCQNDIKNSCAFFFFFLKMVWLKAVLPKSRQILSSGHNHSLTKTI